MTDEQNIDLPQVRDTDAALEEKAKYLKGKVEYAVLKLRLGRNENRRRAIYLKISTIVLTAGATLLLGLQMNGFSQIQRQLAFVFASLATLVNVLEPFFTFRGLWVAYEVAQWKMHRLQDELEYYLNSVRSADPQVLEGFQQKYLEIWDNFSESWIQKRKRAELSNAE